MTLDSLAIELKKAARANPINLQHVLGLQFPPELHKEITVNGILYDLQFSYDQFPDSGELCHLSFARHDQKMIDGEDPIRLQMRRAFFGDEQNLIQFPGNPVFGKHINHIGLIVPRQA